MIPNRKIGMKPETPANKELHGGKSEAGSSAPGEMGAVRFPQPEIHENSNESEIIMESSTNLEGLSMEAAETERRKFNAGALTDPFENLNRGDELLEDNRNAENQFE